MNIVPTQYWIDTFGQRQFKPWESQCNPDGWAEANKVDYFCHKWEWDSECRPFDEATIKQWTDNFADCLQEVRLCVCAGSMGGQRSKKARALAKTRSRASARGLPTR